MSMLSPTEEAAVDMTPLHEPFTYLPNLLRHDYAARFAEQAYDISAGIEACVGLLHGDELRRQNGEPPVLNLNDAGKMFRLVVASARMLSLQAERAMDHFEECAEKREGT